jgi:hypothetical protein
VIRVFKEKKVGRESKGQRVIAEKRETPDQLVHQAQQEYHPSLMNKEL